MPLDFGIDIATAECGDQPIKAVAAFAPSDGESEWPIPVTRETNQTFGEFSELFRRRGGFFAGLRVFRGAELCSRNQAAKILVTGTALGEQRVVAPIRAEHFGTGVTAQIVFLHRGKEPGGAVDAIAIEKRHGRNLQLGGDLRVLFRERRAAQKTEGGPGMQFDEGHQS